MSRILTLTFEFDEEEWQEFLEKEEVQGVDDTYEMVNNFVFAEFCQNHGMGMLTGCTIGNAA